MYVFLTVRNAYGLQVYDGVCDTHIADPIWCEPVAVTTVTVPRQLRVTATVILTVMGDHASDSYSATSAIYVIVTMAVTL